METSYLLARVIGPYLMIAGIGLFISRKQYLELVDEFPQNKALTIAIGAISLMAGLLMLQFHNIWTANWPILITVFGWIVTLKGATALLFPNALLGMSKTYRNNDRLLNINTAITILFGAALCYMGYFS
jgi:hypothetical protein